MTLFTDKDERLKKLFGKIAIFILLAATGMALALFWTGEKKGAFTAKSPIYFVADSGEGLSVGMPVKFSGFKIGKLSSLTLDEQGLVQVEVSIETKYLNLIRQDAVMSLRKEGVIGDGVLEISQGAKDKLAKNKPALAAGGKVRFERASGLEQAVVDMKDRILPILDDLHQTIHDPDGDVRQTLKNLHELSKEMRGTRERLDRVLDSVDGNLNNNVEPLLRSLKLSAANAETLSVKLNHDLPALLNKVDGSMENLRVTSEIIKDTVQRSSPQIPGMLDEARNTMGMTRGLVGDTQEVIDSLNTHWPLKNIVPAPETGPVKMDSHD